MGSQGDPTPPSKQRKGGGTSGPPWVLTPLQGPMNCFTRISTIAEAGQRSLGDPQNWSKDAKHFGLEPCPRAQGEGNVGLEKIWCKKVKNKPKYQSKGEKLERNKKFSEKAHEKKNPPIRKSSSPNPVTQPKNPPNEQSTDIRGFIHDDVRLLFNTHEREPEFFSAILCLEKVMLFPVGHFAYISKKNHQKTQSFRHF